MNEKPDIKKIDGKELTEDQAKQMFGPDVAGFMKAVAKAGKCYKIDGCVIWMTHRNFMRCSSFGYAPGGRAQARTLALWLSDQATLLLGKARGSA